MVPTEMETRWEVAYRGYCTAARLATAGAPDDQNVARMMVSTSEDVAAAWREMRDVTDLPWWAQGALSAAVEAFESQARDWALRIADPVATDDPTAPFPRPFPRPSTVDDEYAPDPVAWPSAGY
jgi:hypothetical protein